MATGRMSEVIEHLRRTVLVQDGEGLTDGQLLECYIRTRDQASLGCLVRRHGPMVWGVCRRLLRSPHDAEDAFQATFLVLVRRAASITSRELVANWLYGVARQTARKARATAAKRSERERQVGELPEPGPSRPAPTQDLHCLLDEELCRLPDKYRIPLVLCDLGGRTRKEAAQQLGCPEGTVAGRLARAREMLARRLARRGVDPSGLTGLPPPAVPGIVVSSTIQAVTTGSTSAPTAALIQGVLNAMFVTKLKTAAGVLAMLGAATLTCGMLAGKGDGPEKAAAKQREDEKSAKKTAPDPKADALRRERKKFEGEWRLASSKTKGEEGLKKGQGGGSLVFYAGGRVISNGDTEGTSEIHLDTEPRSIHFTPASKSKGRPSRFIYEFIDADTFRWRPYSSEKERPTDFDTGLVLVLERVMKPGTIGGVVREIDGEIVLLTSGQRVMLDAKTKYLRETLDDAAPAEITDVTKGKLVDIGTKQRGGRLFAEVVILRFMQPPSAKEKDAALLERLKMLGLKDPDAAKDIALIRRLYLDILGVPPSPREIDDFLRDKDADKRDRLKLRLTNRFAPGRYAGACQVMAIAADGVVTYPDSPGPVICHIEFMADGGLKAEFPDKQLGRGKWHTLTLKLSGREPRTAWTATMKGDTYRATAIPYSPEAHLFRLEILTGGKLVAGAQQFFAIRGVRAEEK